MSATHRFPLSQLFLLFALAFSLTAAEGGGCGTRHRDAHDQGTDNQACEAPQECRPSAISDCDTPIADCVSGQCVTLCADPDNDQDTQGGTDTIPGKGCYDTGDCDDGLRCSTELTGDCFPPPGCSDGMDCAAVCYGQCLDASDLDTSDGDTADSDAGEQDGDTTPDPELPTLCQSTEHCGPGQRCDDPANHCYSSPHCDGQGPCTDDCWGICVPDEWRVPCLGDEQCQPYEFCAEAPCLEGDDAHCHGYCAPYKSCYTDETCEDGERCLCPYSFSDGTPYSALMICPTVCMPDPNACRDSAECAAGEICASGQCVESKRSCIDDDSCAPGWECTPDCGDPTGAGHFGADGRPACPMFCTPKDLSCASGDIVCDPGAHCIDQCYTECDTCDGAPCDCEERCSASCVPTYDDCRSSGCPDGQSCLCESPFDPSPQALFYCEFQCIDDGITEGCFDDSMCAPDESCDLSGCPDAMPPQCDDSSDPNCRPVPCPGRCIPLEDTRVDCLDDSHCQAPQTCNREACVPPPYVPCPPGEPCPAPLPPLCFGFCE